VFRLRKKDLKKGFLSYHNEIPFLSLMVGSKNFPIEKTVFFQEFLLFSNERVKTE